MKLISIIIATYNASATLRQCLDSIIPQLDDECELIIIDGCSKDNTNNIIASYGDKIAYTVSEKDNGVYDAWNKGIIKAQGKWIMFVGADDMLLPNAIKTYLSNISSKPDIQEYDYICAQNEFVDHNGKLLKLMGEKPAWNVMRRTMAAAHVASLHNKKNLFDTIGTYNLRFNICADYELLLRKKEKLKSLFIDAHIARMKIGGMSFTSKAIVETYKIRRLHHSIPNVANECLFIRDWLAFKFFVFRKSLLGGKMS